MAELSTDRVALDEYMGVWFRGEVSDMVELRSMVGRCRTLVQDRILRRRRVICHLENVKGCPTYGWLERLRENQMEDLAQLGVLNPLLDRIAFLTDAFGMLLFASYFCAGSSGCDSCVLGSLGVA
nr:hypothetical protein [Tanacetum cinerariifolium]